MEINFQNIGLLFFRLAPFIIVCFFTLGSLLNQDLRGFIYLVGLIVSFAIDFLLSSASSSMDDKIGSLIEPNENHCIKYSFMGTRIENVLGLNALAYTFGYLFWSMYRQKYIQYNIATIVLLPALIIAHIISTLMCSGRVAGVAFSLVIGVGMGILWAYMLQRSKRRDLLYFFGGQSSKEICSAPSKQHFRCQMYKDGQPISLT